MPPSANPDFLKFVTGFTRHSTLTALEDRRWARWSPINDLPLESFDLLARRRRHAPRPYEREVLPRRLPHRATSAGPCSRRSSTSTPPVSDIEFDVLDRRRGAAPSSRRCPTRSARRSVLHGQRFINPGAYVHALADAVIARGGKIVTGAPEVLDIVETGRRRRAS